MSLSTDWKFSYCIDMLGLNSEAVRAEMEAGPETGWGWSWGTREAGTRLELRSGLELREELRFRFRMSPGLWQRMGMGLGSQLG